MTGRRVRADHPERETPGLAGRFVMDGSKQRALRGRISCPA
ncbi:MAG: hypothetical protein ACTHOH_03415 [Lysobacteraceae bacterium]